MNRREFAAGASLVVGAVVVGLLAALISLLGARTRFEPVPVGDQLGQDNGETFAEYVERADASLDDAPGDAPVFAFVTFADEASPDEASAALESVNRVDAVIPPDAPLQPVGEPKEGRGRTDIFRIAVDGDIAGAVVRDTGDALRAVLRRTDRRRGGASTRCGVGRIRCTPSEYSGSLIAFRRPLPNV